MLLLISWLASYFISLKHRASPVSLSFYYSYFYIFQFLWPPHITSISKYFRLSSLHTFIYESVWQLAPNKRQHFRRRCSSSVLHSRGSRPQLHFCFDNSRCRPNNKLLPHLPLVNVFFVAIASSRKLIGSLILLPAHHLMLYFAFSSSSCLSHLPHLSPFVLYAAPTCADVPLFLLASSNRYLRTEI